MHRVSQNFIESQMAQTPPPHESASGEGEIPQEFLEIASEAQGFIDDHHELFCAIAGDRSLQFEIGPSFFINLKSGSISLSVYHYMLMKEKGLSEYQMIWGICHELGHFFDLKEDPEKLLERFTYMQDKAAELVPQVKEIWQKQFGKLPAYLDERVSVGSKGKRKITQLHQFLYETIFLLYNCLDDMYVNGGIGTRSAIFDEEGSQGFEVERLYRDYLFATDPKKQGEPPRESQAADYTRLPMSYQLVYSLIRKRMVPNQAILVRPEVREALSGFSDKVAEAQGLSLEEEVDSFTSLSEPRAASAGWRTDRIKESVEPVFLELFFQDLEKMQMCSDRKKSKKNGQWDQLDDKPEPLDREAIEDFLKQKAAKEEEMAKEDELERMAPDERADAAHGAVDRDMCRRYNVPPRLAREYRMIEHAIDPYKRELAEVFEEMMQQVSEQIESFWVEGFRTGRFNVSRFIDKYAPELGLGAHDSIPWDSLDVYDQQEFISHIEILPRILRLRLDLDGSGSMDTNRIIAVKLLYTLFQEAASTFEQTFNLRFKLQKPIHVDTGVWIFGSVGRSKCIKNFSYGKTLPDEEIADRFRALGAIHNKYGGTCDAESLWKIVRTMDAETKRDLAAGTAKDLLFEVTDGGSNETSIQGMRFVKGVPKKEKILFGKKKVEIFRQAAQDTRNAIDAYERAGGIARAVQVGTPKIDEIATFETIWGAAGRRVKSPKDLAGAVKELLSDELRKIQFQVRSGK